MAAGGKMIKPLSKAEFFRRFNEICNRRVVGSIVKVDCPSCKGEAKLVAFLTHPRGGVFSEIDCPRCGSMYRGLRVEGGPADG